MIQRELTISLLDQQGNPYENENINSLVSVFNQKLAERLYQNILLQANVLLVSTRENYIQALSLQGETIILDTTDFVVSLVELGSPPFDMKKGLLASPKVKIAANGERYISVPLDKFRGGKYNWRDRETGKFSVGSNPGGSHEFRVVSSSSPEDSWVHPGHHGFNIVDREIERFQVEEQIEEILTQVF